MKTRFFTLAAGMLLSAVPHSALAQPTPAAKAAFDAYIAGVESRLAQQHRSAGAFLVSRDPVTGPARLEKGETIIERLTPSSGAEVSGSLMHDWRGTTFVPGATAQGFEQLMQDFAAYPQRFSPQVLRARLIARSGDHMHPEMRIRQQHVITVVMDTAYDITYGRLDAQHGYSTSRSTRIAEIYAPGTNAERALNPDEEHGFLWRLNTYWTYEEKDGGLYLQVEAVSLTRSIPHGLGWAIGPYIESIPRDSLEFTLRSTANALRTQKGQER
jgi:hypothetical protein